MDGETKSILETPSESLSHFIDYLEEEIKIQKRDCLSTVAESSQQTKTRNAATPEGQLSYQSHIPRPTSYRPVRDTAFDIEQLSRISRHASNPGTYRYRYHNESPQKTGDLSIINCNSFEDSAILPSSYRESQEKLPPIRSLFPQLQSRWQTNHLDCRPLMRN